MEGKNKFIDRPKTDSEIRATEGPLLETKIPERKVDAFSEKYRDSGFDNVGGIWKRVNLDKLLGEDVKPEDKLADSIVKENPIVDSDTTVADFTGFDKKSDKKGPVLVGLYNDRQEKIQKAKITEIGK